MITHDLRVIADAILDKKGENVVSIDLRSIGTAITDYFVVCDGSSTTNVSAIADNILKEAKEKLGLKPSKVQGLENNFWVIMDFGNIVVHVFQKEYREFYRLEDLWADAKRKLHKDEPKKTAAKPAEGETKRIKPKAATKVRAAAKKIAKRNGEE